MKRLTLDETWVLCLQMWKWIAEQVEKDTSKDIDELKIEWIDNHGYKDGVIDHDCFFCEYDERYKDRLGHENNCKFCPAVEINRRFHCGNKTYSFSKRPLAFYAKLVELNKKRLSKKRK